MIEEIKKYIQEEKVYIEEVVTNVEVIAIDKLFYILDKHNTMYPDYKDLLYQNDSLHSELQELKDYKNAWEELKNTQYSIGEIGTFEEELDIFEELEQKYNLGGE